MKTIRHLMTIVFLLCGLTALGSERGYDRNDLVGTYKYNDTKEYVLDLHLHSDNTFMVSSAASDDSFRRFGNWEVKDDLVILHFDKSETDSLQVQNDLDRYVMKELEILDKNNLFWGYHLQEGYEKRVELCRYAPKESSPKRKAQKEVWKDLIEQVVQEVVG